MSTDAPEMSAYSRMASVWNEMMDIRSTLPADQFTALTAILSLLDTLIYAMDPGTCPQPVPIYYRDCQCKPKHDG
jgi:hypothetical protein